MFLALAGPARKAKIDSEVGKSPFIGTAEIIGCVGIPDRAQVKWHRPAHYRQYDRPCVDINSDSKILDFRWNLALALVRLDSRQHTLLLRPIHHTLFSIAAGFCVRIQIQTVLLFPVRKLDLVDFSLSF